MSTRRSEIEHLVSLLVFLAIVFAPIFVLLVDAFQYLRNPPPDLFVLVVPTGRRLGLLINSLGLAASVAGSGMAVGLMVATVLWKWQRGLGAYARWFLLILAPLPPYVHALAWSSTVSVLRAHLQWLGLGGMALTGWIGSWWVQVMALLPVAAGLALLGLESVEDTMFEAGRLARSDLQAFVRIALPLAAPAIVAGIGFLFLLSIVDYTVPSLFSLNVYSLEIFAEYSASNQPARAFLLGLPLLIVTMIVVTVTQAKLRNTAQSVAWQRRKTYSRPDWPRWFVWLQYAAVVLVALQIGVPLTSLAVSVGTWQNLLSTIVAAGSEITYTFWIAMVTSVLCLPVAVAAARMLTRSGLTGRVWWLLVTAPLAIPAPLVGIGLIAVWSYPSGPTLYGSSLMPVLAVLARFAPFVALAVLAQLRHTDPLLIDAARVLERSRLRMWLQIKLPMLAPGLLAGAAIAFALTTGELGATLIVVPPGQATLTIRIYNYLEYGASSAVAGLCLMMTVFAVVAGALAVAAMLSWSRITEEQP